MSRYPVESSARGKRCSLFGETMPPAKRQNFSHRPNRKSTNADGQDAPNDLPTEAIPAPRVTAAERKQLFARLLWLFDYKPIFAAERELNKPLLELLKSNYTSAHTWRLMHSSSAAGEAATAAVEARLGECIGFLERSRNRLHVPFSQVAKAISYLASGTPKVTWTAERKAQRVVGRAYAIDVLEEMALCRPPPPFEELEREVLVSIAFDQTYAKAGAGTGVSRYNGVQTVDKEGNAVGRERMVYINGQFFPVPRLGLTLSADACTRIAAVGPYTQDFRRIMPLLQPYRLDRVMDDFVRRAVGLLGGQPPASTRGAMGRLLSRPNDNPGAATYLTFMTPLLWVNTQSYIDLMRIVAWCITFIGCCPLILHLIGDGQSILRLRDLKRLHPARFKHVLIGNGHFHSGAHSSFADVTLWWWCLLCCCMLAIGKVRRDADGSFKGTVRPAIKSLECNATGHVQQALLAVTVAILVFFTTKVTSPPPDLFLSDPIVYLSRIENASGVVLAEFLRHSGLPTLFWQRGTRGREGKTLDDLHCLALHKFRCAHKTSSSQISLLHLISIFGTHPELRDYLRSRLFVNITPAVGGAVGADRSVECMNDDQKEFNVHPSLMQSLAFTRLLQPMYWVYRQWKIATGTLAAADTGVRASMENEIDVLVCLFVEKIGTDLETYTTHNNLWWTGTPVDMRSASNLKKGRPWAWIWSVARGMSTCLAKEDSAAEARKASTETWWRFIERHLFSHMFSQ